MRFLLHALYVKFIVVKKGGGGVFHSNLATLLQFDRLLGLDSEFAIILVVSLALERLQLARHETLAVLGTCLPTWAVEVGVGPS